VIRGSGAFKYLAHGWDGSTGVTPSCRQVELPLRLSRRLRRMVPETGTIRARERYGVVVDSVKTRVFW
jgi:hypothetical protein